MLKPIVLKNGITVLRIPKNNSNIFTVGFVAHTGSANEKGNFPLGISSLVEKMFWCGTDKHPSKRGLNTALESIGGNFASLTTHELSQYYLTVPCQHQFKAISMLAEVIQHSFFDQKDLYEQKYLAIDRIKQQEDLFNYEGSYLGLMNIYSNHPLGEYVCGDIEDLTTVDQEAILEFLSAQYQPSRSYLILAGNFQTKETTDLLDQEWGYWNPKPKEYKGVKGFYYEQTLERLPSLVYKQRGISKTQMVAGFLLEQGLQPRILRDYEEGSDVKLDIAEIQEKFLTETATLMVLNTIIGQGMSSRLWTKGVEEEMLFDRVYSNLIRFTGTGYLEIVGTAENNQFTFALECIFSVLDSLKKTTVSINELAKAKEYIKGKLTVEQEDLLSAIVWQVENVAGSGLTFEVGDLLNKVDKVDAATLRAVASNLFKRDKFFLTTYGTAKETRLVDKLIERYL